MEIDTDRTESDLGEFLNWYHLIWFHNLWVIRFSCMRIHKSWKLFWDEDMTSQNLFKESSLIQTMPKSPPQSYVIEPANPKAGCCFSQRLYLSRTWDFLLQILSPTRVTSTWSAVSNPWSRFKAELLGTSTSPSSRISKARTTRKKDLYQNSK